MRSVLILLSVSVAFAQLPKPGGGGNSGGYTAPSGYTFTLTAQTTASVTAATHGQGTLPEVACYQSSNGEKVAFQLLNPSFLGELTLNFGAAFTGTCRVAGPGVNAGAAGDVVGPASSTNTALACFSGTSGKIIAGCSQLSTAGAIPYVTSAGVLGQDAGLNWDSVTQRLIVLSPAPLGGNSIIFSFGIGDASGRFAISEGAGATIMKFGDSLTFQRSSTDIARFAPTTSNFILGGITDNNYKQSVQSSGSTGTFFCGDLTPTTGSTLCDFRAGAAQSGPIFKVTSSAVATLFSFASDGIPQWASIAEPTCNSGNRGKVTMVQGGAGVADTYRICKKDAADAYAWTALY